MGSGIQQPCPLGTFMPSVGNTGNAFNYNNQTYFCQLCPEGKACDSLGIGLSANLLSSCEGGHYCAIGSPSVRPICTEGFCQSMYGICPPGYYCPAGVSVPKRCLDGYYMNSTGATSCIPCPQVLYPWHQKTHIHYVITDKS